MKRVAMVLVTVAALTWSAAPVVERAPEPPPPAPVQIPHAPMIGWAISKWDREVGEITGVAGGTIMALRGAREGYVIGGLFGGIAGALFGGALGGF